MVGGGGCELYGLSPAGYTGAAGPGLCPRSSPSCSSMPLPAELIMCCEGCGGYKECSDTEGAKEGSGSMYVVVAEVAG